MALSGVQLDDLKVYGKERVLVGFKLTVGAAGAVGTVSKGPFAATAVLPYKGSVTKESTDGQYTIVMPGQGGLDDIAVLQPVIEHATDVLHATVISKDLTARSVTIQLWDADTPAETNASEGAIIHFNFICKNSDLSP